MSTPDSISSLAASALGSTPVPVVNQALEPAAVRNGSATVKQAYNEALAFESVLVNQLCQQLVSSSGLGSSSSDGDSGDDSSQSDPSVSDFDSLIPSALSSSIMSSGGLGLAAQIYPTLEGQAGGNSTASGGSSDGSTVAS
jgi:Rod binding domain-containing protein